LEKEEEEEKEEQVTEDDLLDLDDEYDEEEHEDAFGGMGMIESSLRRFCCGLGFVVLTCICAPFQFITWLWRLFVIREDEEED